jgi:hypothetical protein
MSMLISPAYAQDITGMFGNATQFLPLVLIFVVFYFLLIRPQQQKQKEMRNMLSQLKRGDRVVTGGGIVGAAASSAPCSGCRWLPTRMASRLRRTRSKWRSRPISASR